MVTDGFLHLDKNSSILFHSIFESRPSLIYSARLPSASILVNKLKFHTKLLSVIYFTLSI